MTDDDVVEAMAIAVHEHRRRLTPLVISFGWYDLDPEDQRRLMDEQRAAIRACHAAGGLVVGKMPGDAPQPASVTGYAAGVLGGYNTALREVRAAAVEVE